MRKELAGLLVCIFLAGSMPVLAASGTENRFVFANTNGLLIGDFYSETVTDSEISAPVSQKTELEREQEIKEMQDKIQKEKEKIQRIQQGIEANNTEKSIDSGEQAQNLVPAQADYDNVAMGDNMLQTSVDGTKMTFYLESANSASDGYELRYISFTPDGEARYCIYLRIPLGATAGSYSSGDGYFSISTSYNEEKDQWGSSYKAIYDGKGEKGKHSSTFSGNWGSYSLTLDQDMGWEGKEISGTLSAEMEGFSSSTEGKTVSITDGVFRAVKGETHEVVRDWQSGSLAGSSEGWVDPYAGTDKQEKKVCSKCGGTGKVICSFCDGAGTILQRKEGIDLGSGSTGYTVEVDCGACDGGYNKCSRCGGSGYEY